MLALKIIFWILAGIIFYTFFGYGILLWIMVKIKELFCKRKTFPVQEEYPEVTLLIAAYNEQEYVEEKMRNCRAIDYPKDKLHIVWVTDGSSDATPELLKAYPENTVYHEAARKGKTAALNRVMEFIHTPFVVMTDANTNLNAESIYRIIRKFDNPKVGCVAGEKRVMTDMGSAAGTEGVYWKYESFLKDLDDRLYSEIGAAGELVAVRRELWTPIPAGVLGDDMNMALNMFRKGYINGYCKDAFALEKPSANIAEERKRKVRLGASGFQVTREFRDLLNPFKYGILAFQFASHRVIRWVLTPSCIVLLAPVNIALVCCGAGLLYTIILGAQAAFYLCVLLGKLLDRKGKQSVFHIPYYFIFANFSTFAGLKYYLHFDGNAAWERSKRA